MKNEIATLEEMQEILRNRTLSVIENYRPRDDDSEYCMGYLQALNGFRRDMLKQICKLEQENPQ